MHTHAYFAVAQMMQLVKKPTRVLEVGSRDINGSVRPLFLGCARYLGTDIADGPGVDVVADGASYVPPFAPDCIVCCEVLEHTDSARTMVSHFGQIVAPGGSVLITCAGPGRKPHSAADGREIREGEYYGNVEPDDMRAWLKEAGLREVWIMHEPERGDLYACGVRA